jgi:hypothetical protein
MADLSVDGYGDDNNYAKKREEALRFDTRHARSPGAKGRGPG